MVMSNIKKIKLNRRRAALINSTSLEILKQKKSSEATRIGGSFFSKQFVSLALYKVLRDRRMFLVAVKSVDVGGGGDLPLFSIYRRKGCTSLQS